MTELHAILPTGKVLTGVVVFQRLYECVGLGWVYAFLRIPGVLGLAERVYAVWAKYRMQLTGRPDLAEVLDMARRRREGTASCAAVRDASGGASEPPSWEALGDKLRGQQVPSQGARLWIPRTTPPPHTRAGARYRRRTFASFVDIVVIKIKNELVKN